MNRSMLQGASATVALLVGLGFGNTAWAAASEQNEAVRRVRQHVQMLKEVRKAQAFTTKPQAFTVKPQAFTVKSQAFTVKSQAARLRPGIRLASFSPEELAAEQDGEQDGEVLEDVAEPMVVELPVDSVADEVEAPPQAEPEPVPAPVPKKAEAPPPEPAPAAKKAQVAPSPAKAESRQVITASAEVPPQPDLPGVLTRKGTLVVEPSIEYSHTDVNQFSFGGVAILDTVLVGAIEAKQANRDAVTATLGLRYGFTNRLEGELRLPYMYRNDSTTNTFVNSSNIAARTDLSDHGLGDIEGAVHYQINDGFGKWPVLVANFRAKSNTGTGPYDVSRDSLGIEEELATGSGFWGFEPSLTVIAPSDPAVFYANVGYLWNVERDIDKQIGSRTVRTVDPGDAVRIGVGMGLALNEKVSFSIGYQHDWIMKTTTEFADGDVDSEALSVGSMTFGVNWQMSDTTALNVSVAIGVTSDAPDVRLMARVPIAVNLF